MEQSTSNQPTTLPAQPTVSPQTIYPVPVQKPRRLFDPRFFFILLIIVGIGGGFFAASIQKKELPAPAPSDTPTPSPRSKPVVPMATQSAYIDISNSVSSLAASLKNLQVTDTTLSPPTIELPLGFPNE